MFEHPDHSDQSVHESPEGVKDGNGYCALPTAASADKVAIDFIVESLFEAMRLNDQGRLDADAKVVNPCRLLNDIITCGSTRGAGIYKKIDN